jgi:DNA-binding GntR family transcriptional regulator
MSESTVESDLGADLLSTRIKRLLLDRVMRGHYQPGERIVELRLAKELGTSQSPIREALRDLAAIGVVTIHSRRGARVRLPTSKELADVSLVRSEIDALAARLAAPLLAGDALVQLGDACEEMASCLARDDHIGLTVADAQFHRIIVQASENHAIERVFDQLEPFARTFITLTLPNVDVRAIVDEHAGILRALEQHDAEASASLARQHQVNVSNLFRDHFALEPGDAVPTEDRS